MVIGTLGCYIFYSEEGPGRGECTSFILFDVTLQLPVPITGLRRLWDDRTDLTEMTAWFKSKVAFGMIARLDQLQNAQVSRLEA